MEIEALQILDRRLYRFLNLAVLCFRQAFKNVRPARRIVRLSYGRRGAAGVEFYSARENRRFFHAH